jgi:2-oxoglutarate dehydrogenase E1 component
MKLVAFESFLHKSINDFRWKETITPALDLGSIWKKAVKEESRNCWNGNIVSRLNVLANIFDKSTQDIFGNLTVKDYDQEYLMGTKCLGYTVDSEPSSSTGKQISIICLNPSHLKQSGIVRNY